MIDNPENLETGTILRCVENHARLDIGRLYRFVETMPDPYAGDSKFVVVETLQGENPQAAYIRGFIPSRFEIFQ